MRLVPLCPAPTITSAKQAANNHKCSRTRLIAPPTALGPPASGDGLRTTAHEQAHEPTLSGPSAELARNRRRSDGGCRKEAGAARDGQAEIRGRERRHGGPLPADERHFDEAVGRGPRAGTREQLRELRVKPMASRGSGSCARGKGCTTNGRGATRPRAFLRKACRCRRLDQRHGRTRMKPIAEGEDQQHEWFEVLI